MYWIRTFSILSLSFTARSSMRARSQTGSKFGSCMGSRSSAFSTRFTYNWWSASVISGITGGSEPGWIFSGGSSATRSGLLHLNPSVDYNQSLLFPRERKKLLGLRPWAKLLVVPTAAAGSPPSTFTQSGLADLRATTGCFLDNFHSNLSHSNHVCFDTFSLSLCVLWEWSNSLPSRID